MRKAAQMVEGLALVVVGMYLYHNPSIETFALTVIYVIGSSYLFAKGMKS